MSNSQENARTFFLNGDVGGSGDATQSLLTKSNMNRKNTNSSGEEEDEIEKLNTLSNTEIGHSPPPPPPPPVKINNNVKESVELKFKKRPSIKVVRDVNVSGDIADSSEVQLEAALVKGHDVIVIEPMKLADETARWISLGNVFHKTALIGGITSIVSGYFWPERTFVYLPTATLSLLCAGVYAFSWQNDPCAKYQVETDLNELGIQINTLQSSSPVIIVKREDGRKRILHTVVSSIAGFYSAYKLIRPTFTQRLNYSISSSMSNEEQFLNISSLKKS